MEVDEVHSVPVTKHTIKCKLGILTRPDGSALFCEGETAVIAGIYGPIEERIQKVQIDKATVECIYRPVSGLPGLQDRFREHLIRNLCATAVATSLYPRAGVVINIQEMQNHGQTISCAINAACMACLDSGVDMKFIFAAVSCFLMKDDEFSFSSPANESNLRALFVFVFNNTTGKILVSHTEGCFSVEQYQNALSLCRDESQNVFRFFKTTLLPVNK